MKKYTNFPTPGTESENVVSIPNNSDASCPGEEPVSDSYKLKGMPVGFLLRDDGIYQLRPGGGEELEPVKICSPMIVTGQCRWSNGTDWRAVEIQDPDGVWISMII